MAGPPSFGGTFSARLYARARRREARLFPTVPEGEKPSHHGLLSNAVKRIFSLYGALFRSPWRDDVKFLVITKVHPGAAPSSRVVEASVKQMDEHCAKGVFDCTYIGPVGTGITIVNAQSHEQLLEILIGFPMHAFLDFEVLPLSDYKKGSTKFLEMIKAQGQ